MASSQTLIRCHSSSLNGCVGANMVAPRPTDTESVVMPTRPNASSSTGLPMITPIDPVSVPGCATMTSAAIEM